MIHIMYTLVNSRKNYCMQTLLVKQTLFFGGGEGADDMDEWNKVMSQNIQLL